jgi:hypothetical protein
MNSILTTHVERLLALMDGAERAVAAQDAGAVLRCTESLNEVTRRIAADCEAAVVRLDVENGAVAERLAALLRAAIERVEHNRTAVQQWKQQTQDALRAITNGQEAIGRYADSLGAHRRELFDLSA